MVSGVPTGMSRASFRMSAFRMRTQPCETWPGQDVGLIRPVHADEAAARPVGEHRRARARPEGDGAVERIVEVRELAPDVELAARCGPVRPPDADDRSEDGLAVALQRRRQRSPIDVEVRAHLVEVAEYARLDPAGRVVRQDRQPDAVPGLVLGDVDPVEDENEVLRAVARHRLQRRDLVRGRARPRADERRRQHHRPVRDLLGRQRVLERILDRRASRRSGVNRVVQGRRVLAHAARVDRRRVELQLVVAGHSRASM